MKNIVKKMSAVILACLMVSVFALPLLAESDIVLDFSSLNRTPAGGYGYVVVQDDNLAFDLNGNLTSVRFVGVSYDLTKGFPSQQTAEAMAEELYRNGVNLVVFDNVFEALATEGLDLDEDKISEFDVLVHELYRKGIYVYFKMFTPSALRTGSVDLFVNSEVINLTQRFLKKFLSHYNLNNTTYAKDPTVVAIQYCSDASAIWQNPDDRFVASAELTSKFNTWLSVRYEESMTALRKAWNKGTYLVNELKDTEDFQAGTVKAGVIPTGGQEARIDWDTVMSNGRQADFLRFMADTEKEMFDSLTKYVRSLNYDGLMICSDTSSGPLSTSLAGTGDAASKKLSYTSDMSLTDAFSVLASGVVSGKAFFAGWDTSVDCSDKADAYLKLTLYASLQGWDALVLGEYSYDDTVSYNVKKDTEIWSLLGLYSNIFRSRYISEAKQSIDIVYSEADALCESGLYGVLAGNLVYFSKVGNVFLAKDEVYSGKATVAVSSGNTSNGDYSGAKAWILHSSVSYTDQYLTGADKSYWLNREIQKVPKRTWVDEKIGGMDLHIATEYIVVRDSVLDTLDKLSAVLRRLSVYPGQMVVDGIAYSDTNQLAYDLQDGTLTLIGNRVIIVSDELKNGLQVSDFNFTTTSDQNNIVVYTPDSFYLETGKEYIVYVGGMEDSDTGVLKIQRANYDCRVFGINADGTRGEEITVDNSIRTSTATVPISGKYWLYDITFTKRDLDDSYRNNDVTAPEPRVRPNLLLLITLPAAGFLAVAVVIVIINDRKRAKVEEELRISSLAEFKKKQAEHRHRTGHYGEDEDE